MMAQKADHLEELSNSNRQHLTKLAVGQRVRIQNAVTKRWDRTGVVTRILRAIRQYTIRLDGSGRLVLRNRKFLRPITAPAVGDLVTPQDNTNSEPSPMPPCRRSERLALRRDRPSTSHQESPSPRRSERLALKEQGGGRR